MKYSIWAALLVVGCGLLAGRAQAENSKVYDACARSLAVARLTDDWQWRTKVTIEPDDVVFQRELSGVMAGEFAAVDVTAPSKLAVALGRAARLTASFRRLARKAKTLGFSPRLQVDVSDAHAETGEDGRTRWQGTLRVLGRANDASLVLRASLAQLRKQMRGSGATLDNTPNSWYDAPVKGGAVLHTGCRDINGYCKYTCSYRMSSEAECMWQDRIRKMGVPRAYGEIDRADVWALLDARPCDYNFERVRQALGKPLCSILLTCATCGARDMRWGYGIADKDDFGAAVRHMLVFSFTPEGCCKGWVWEME